MNREFVIDSDVPPPAPRTKRGKWVRLATKMEIGDSVLLNDYTESNSLYRALERLGFGARTARDNGGIRLWKLADKQKS